VRIIEGLSKCKGSSFGLEKRDSRPWGPVTLTTRHPLTAKVGAKFADKWRPLGRNSPHAG
jgi:hypothetical protein